MSESSGARFPSGYAVAEASELLEVFTPDGKPMGVAKSRRAVHEDGDWHLSFFCWVVRRGERGIEALLQHRSHDKSTFPGRFDASCAGHVRFGETLAQASRELEEELGLRVAMEDLTPLPMHRQEHLHASGLIDREHQAVHLLAVAGDLMGFRPDPVEVLGLAWVGFDDLIAVAEGSLATATSRYWPSDCHDSDARNRPIAAGDLVPYPPLYYQVLRSAAQMLFGRPS
ncbi:MAG: NUDIX domain-containing protein [Chloroflexota bacterium]